MGELLRVCVNTKNKGDQMTKRVSTETKILEVGLTLIQERGINGFSFADIAERIGIKKASIHYYFPTKLDLVKGVLVYYKHNFFVSLNAICQDKETLKEILLAYGNLYKLNLQENNWVCLCSMLATESFSLDRELKQGVNDFFMRNIQWIEEKMKSFGMKDLVAEERSNQLFVVIQGIQIMTQSLEDVTYFEKIYTQKIKEVIVF